MLYIRLYTKTPMSSKQQGETLLTCINMTKTQTQYRIRQEELIEVGLPNLP